MLCSNTGSSAQEAADIVRDLEGTCPVFMEQGEVLAAGYLGKVVPQTTILDPWRRIIAASSTVAVELSGTIFR